MFGDALEKKDNKNSSGVGIGLTICKELIRILQNNKKFVIDVDSTIGKGSTFSFTVPQITREPDGSEILKTGIS